MAAGGTLKLHVRIEGADEVLRAFTKLPTDATNDLRDKTLEVSKELTTRIAAAGRAQGRQARRAAGTVKAVRDRVPAVQASNTGRAKGLLFGSEFGMNRKSGWYAKRRYFGSPALQFRPHLGGGSYWFFRTAEANQSWMADQWRKVADQVVREWSA